MGKLDINRMANSTKLKKVDDVHVDLEGDLEDIFGIPDNTEITTYVFGRNPDGADAKPIQADGSIRGVPVLRAAAPTSSAGDALGFEFDDGTTRKKISFVQGILKIYEWDGSTWNSVANIEEPGSGLLTSLTDVDITVPLTAADVGWLVGVNATNDAFELIDPSVVAGAATYDDLTDTDPLANGSIGDIPVIEAGPTLGWLTPSVEAGPFVMLLSAIAIHPEDAPGWGSSDIWVDAYNWVLNDPGVTGFLVTDDSTYLGNDGSEANKFIKALPDGVYNASLWYYTSGNADNPYGVRSWRIQGSGIAGPALNGVSHRATAAFDRASQIVEVEGAKFLGSRMFTIESTADDLKFQVKQDSGFKIKYPGPAEPMFYAVIQRVK